MRYIVSLDDTPVYLVKLGPAGFELVAAELVDGEPTQGPQGVRGLPGEVGPQGVPGTSNLEILHGDGPPSDVDPITAGVDGQLYVDDATGDLYERENGLWL